MPRHDAPHRIDYPDQSAYPGAYIVLPPEWLGRHLVRRDAARKAALQYGSEQITVAAIALAIIDEWGGIPGIEGPDPVSWDFAAVPIPLLCWLQVAVYQDFVTAFVVPKASSLPSTNGPAAAGTMTPPTAGSSRPTT
ncbi:MAG: hypothetical protein IT318_23815 [Anaerolineales bacterium]|nr:hypothetical protein [Anaerolineales bacterium]